MNLQTYFVPAMQYADDNQLYSDDCCQYFPQDLTEIDMAKNLSRILTTSLEYTNALSCQDLNIYGSSIITKNKKLRNRRVRKRKRRVNTIERNARERKRVERVNDGFAYLRKHVPVEPGNKKLSKVETLRTAIEYIHYLEEILLSDENYEISGACEFDQIQALCV